MAELLNNPLFVKLYIKHIKKSSNIIYITNNNGFEYHINRDIFDSLSEYSKNIVNGDRLYLDFDTHMLNGFIEVLISQTSYDKEHNFEPESIAHFMIIANYLMIHTSFIKQILKKITGNPIKIFIDLIKYYGSLEEIVNNFSYSNKIIYFVENFAGYLDTNNIKNMNSVDKMTLVSSRYMIDIIISIINNGDDEEYYDMYNVFPELIFDNIDILDVDTMQYIVDNLPWMKLNPSFRKKFSKALQIDFPDISVDKIKFPTVPKNKSYIISVPVPSANMITEKYPIVIYVDDVPVLLQIKMIFSGYGYIKFSICDQQYYRFANNYINGKLTLKIAEYKKNNMLIGIGKKIDISLKTILPEDEIKINFEPSIFTHVVDYKFDIVME